MGPGLRTPVYIVHTCTCRVCNLQNTHKYPTSNLHHNSNYNSYHQVCWGPALRFTISQRFTQAQLSPSSTQTLFDCQSAKQLIVAREAREFYEASCRGVRGLHAQLEVGKRSRIMAHLTTMNSHNSHHGPLAYRSGSSICIYIYV